MKHIILTSFLLFNSCVIDTVPLTECDKLSVYQVTKFPIKISLTEEFPEEHLEAIYLAIDEWNSVAGVDLFIIEPNPITTECGWVKVSNLTYDLKYKKFGTTKWNSCFAFIRLVSLESFELNKNTMKHELGHVLNFYHDSDRASIMYEDILLDQKIKAAHIEKMNDVAQCSTFN